MESFRVTYIGGIGRVTGSCTLIQHNGNKFLIDCGMVQGEAHSDHENKQPFPFNPREIKYVVLTHAHLDHCGLLPRLANEGFIGKVYCTKATRLLTIEILKDAARISRPYQESQIKKLNFECLDSRDGFKWGKLLPIDTNLMLGLYRSAHILGSASAVIADPTTTDSIWFSGDIGRNSREEMLQPLLKYRQSPDFRNKMVVCESTYGAKTDPQKIRGFAERQKFFKEIFERTLSDKHGSVVIPAFSMQRTQDILTDLFLLFKNNPSLCNGVSVVCDSPLARKISSIYADEMFLYETKDGEKNYKYLNPELLEQFSEDSENCLKQLKSIFSSTTTSIGHHIFSWKKSGVTCSSPTVYVTSAGMCSAGPVLKHLRRCLPDENNTVILTGYQGQGTVGSKLLRIMNGTPIDDKPLDEQLHLRPDEVNARILMMGDYSGHADTAGLLDYLFNRERGYTSPVIHLNHGDNQARTQLRNSIESYSREFKKICSVEAVEPKVCVPEPNSCYALKDGKVKLAEPEIQRTDSLSEILHLLRNIDKRLSLLESEILGEPKQKHTLIHSEERKSASKKSKPAMEPGIDARAQDDQLKGERNSYTFTIDNTNYTSDSEILNDICRRHPAIAYARMSEQGGIGLTVNEGRYVIYIQGDFEHSDSEHTSTRNGWIEKESVRDMLSLISTIDVARTRIFHFSFNGPSKSSSKPKHTDQYLKIQRNTDGSIRLI